MLRPERQRRQAVPRAVPRRKGRLRLRSAIARPECRRNKSPLLAFGCQIARPQLPQMGVRAYC